MFNIIFDILLTIMCKPHRFWAHFGAEIRGAAYLSNHRFWWTWFGAANLTLRYSIQKIDCMLCLIR